jgi:hypothetical protein
MLNLVSKKVKLGLVALSTLGSSSVFAIDDAAVTAAFAAGETSVLGGTTGLILLVAAMIGVGIIISLMKKA